MSKVSVCITTYNRRNNVFFAIENILKQTYKNIQLIIVDDCSTDGSQELISKKIKQIDKLDILFIRNSVNKGLASSRNLAINNSKGTYFTFCDDDDIWADNFIAEFVKIASKYDENWCFTCCNSYDIKGKIKHRISNYRDSIKNLVYKGFTPPVASQFYRTSSLKKIDGYNEKIKSGVDHDLWIRLSSIGLNAINIGLPLSYPNIKNDKGRMTKNKLKRTEGITNSLEEWRSIISDIYGEKFYLFFKKNYNYYLIKTFLKQDLKNRNYRDAFNNLIKLNKVFILLDVVKKIKKTIYVKKLYPNFFTFN